MIVVVLAIWWTKFAHQSRAEDPDNTEYRLLMSITEYQHVLTKDYDLNILASSLSIRTWHSTCWCCFVKHSDLMKIWYDRPTDRIIWQTRIKKTCEMLWFGDLWENHSVTMDQARVLTLRAWPWFQSMQQGCRWCRFENASRVCMYIGEENSYWEVRLHSVLKLINIETWKRVGFDSINKPLFTLSSADSAIWSRPSGNGILKYYRNAAFMLLMTTKMWRLSYKSWL